MTANARRLLLPSCLAALAGLAVVMSITRAEPRPQPAPRPQTPLSGEALADRPISTSAAQLLDLAFDTACAIPADPHAKTRAREQAESVEACLDLDQPRRALRFLEGIEDWHRGLAHADLAFWCARNGAAAEARRHIELAELAAEGVARDPNHQAWRRDRVRARIGQALALLGETGRAESFETGAVESESGRVAIVKAGIASPEEFDARLEAFRAVLASRSFDRSLNALAGCIQLYGRFIQDDARRERVAAAVEDGLAGLPAKVRIDVLGQLADAAIAHGRPEKALPFLEEARALAAAHPLQFEDQLPLLAGLARHRSRAGDLIGARRDAAKVFAGFQDQRARIPSGFRAGVLRPLAEAWVAMGDPKAALDVYANAIEEGAVNPNSRPRAEDLGATCRSMARHGIEPGAALWKRLREIRAGLGDPW